MLIGELRQPGGGLDVLTGEDATSDVRSVLSWSYRALGAAAARLFRLLALHPGPDIAVPATASLAGMPVRTARALLAELTRAHLITEHVPGRYVFHDLLRAYATELVDTVDSDDDRRAALHRMLDHYLGTAHAAETLLHPPIEPSAPDAPQPGVLVRRSESQLNAVTAGLSTVANRPKSIVSWYVDVTRNDVVLTATAAADARAFVRAARVDAGATRIVEEADRPRPLYDLRGGDRFGIVGGSYCSVGFAVRGGFVTAGHCVQAGQNIVGYNGRPQGWVGGSIYPRRDMAWTATNEDWHLKGTVNNYQGGHRGGCRLPGGPGRLLDLPLRRQQRLEMRRRGGHRRDRGVPGNVVVERLTQTSACASPGDSGGPVISGDQAQGVLSGGYTFCRTCFQPVNPILNTYDRVLVTAAETTFSLASDASGRCLDVVGDSPNDGAGVGIWDCHNAANQAWRTTTAGELRVHTTRCLDTLGGQTGAGTRVTVSTCDGGDNQQWVIEEDRTIRHVRSGLFLDVYRSRPANGTAVMLYPHHGGANQLWQIRA